MMGNKQVTIDKDPWRKIPWIEKGKLVDKLKQFQPANENVKHIRIMLHGPVGAGKSSFINSVNNIFRGRMTHDAHVAAVSGKSYTITKQTHNIQKGTPQNFCHFVFTDLMGLEENDGIYEEDIIQAMKGHVKDGYRFNRAAPISDKDPHYNPNPAPEDKTHVLVSVIPAPHVRLLSPALIERIKRIRRAASGLDPHIPEICIITKIDELCDEVKKDIRNVYKMKAVRTKMEEFSARSGIPMNCIFPVKNYHEEVDVKYYDDNYLDFLVLNALEHMINFGEDVSNKMNTSC